MKPKEQLLTKEEELELIIKTQQKDRLAEEEIISKNIGLVRSIAHKYFKENLEFDDLYQEGIIALLKSIQSFDAQRDNRLSVYAFPSIHRHIKKAINNNKRIIYIPMWLFTKIKEYKAVSYHLEKLSGIKPKVEEIAEMMNISVKTAKKIEYIIVNMLYVSSLNEIISNPVIETYTPLVNLIVDDSINLTKEIDQSDRHEKISEAFKVLTEREALILKLIYYQNLKRNQVASLIGTSPQYIQQVEKRALTKLKNSSYSKVLKSYLSD